jgi:hypothetical protein
VNLVLFIAQLTHPPELCFGRPEHREKQSILRDYGENREKFEKKAGVKVHGMYLNPNEHTFYIILETEKYANVSKFLRGPWLTHHTAKITPVITLEETLAIAPTISEE